jgi:uncharacterized surface protein with fasciclin (FAS1) repeats
MIMKYSLFGLAGMVAIGAAIPAYAGSAPAIQAQPTEIVETTTTRTVVVGETTLYGQQIAAMLKDNEKASTFRDLIAANGLSKSLRDNDKGYTAFVPVNAAFEGMTLPTPAAVGTVNPQAQAILEDHIVDSKFDVNLLHGQRDSVKSLSGKKITISKAGKNFYANGHLIVGRQHSPEGIIYFIQNVISSPDMHSAVYNPADVKK